MEQKLTVGVLSLVASFLGAVLLIPMVFAHGFDTRILHGNIFALLLVDGLFEGLNVLAFCVALKYTTTARASLAKYLAPSLLVFIFAPLILHESISLKIGAAACLGLLGIFCIPMEEKPPQEGEEPKSYAHRKGLFFGVLCALFFGCLMAVEGKLGRLHIDPYSAMFAKLIIRGCVFGIYVLVVKSEQVLPKRGQWLRIIIFAVALAVSLVFFFTGNAGVPDGSKAKVGVLTYLDLVVTMAVASIFFGEKLHKRTILGGMLILASGILIVLLR